MSSEQGQRMVVRSLIEQAREAWVVRDVSALAKLFTEDAEFIVPGQRWVGLSKIREELSNFAQRQRDVSINIRRVLIDGNQAAVEWHYEDIEAVTGKRNRADDVIIVEVRNGRISYWREYFDTQSVAP